MAIRLLFPMIIVSAMLAASPTTAHSLEVPTHEEVNDQATSSSQLDIVLKTQLGLASGVRHILLAQEIRQWLRVGGAREDNGFVFSPRARFFRHFHDPLRPWDAAGLTATPPRVVRSESALRWAQQTNQGAETNLGDFSWADARRYFRLALTAESPAEREQAFANTFRALGQVMHLLTDMSVPEHVRDDPHAMGAVWNLLGQVGNYEYWVLAQHQRQGAEAAFRQEFLWSSPSFDRAVYEQQFPQEEHVARAPIAFLFDSNRYNGTNPAVTAESAIGLAEVTNVNFFSQDTRSGDEYPFPQSATTESYRRLYPKTGFMRTYYRKLDSGHPVDPVAVECSLQELLLAPLTCFDDHVWRETAHHLLPRAVRYSQELLNYFFRGKLEFEVYPNWQNPEQLSLQIRNLSDEQMTGSFALYTENWEGRRVPVSGASVEGVSLSGVGATDWSTTGSHRIAFTPESGFDVGGLTLVFSGVLGAEQGVVVGNVKPWEPVIFGIQESAEITGGVIEEASSPRIDGETGKMADGWGGQATISISKETRLQRVRGRFAASRDVVAGEYIKRIGIWLLGGWGGIPGITIRLNEATDVGLEWNRDVGPTLVPTTWEIIADLPSAPDPSSGSSLPTVLYVETLTGKIWSVPVVWWVENASSGFASVQYGARDCMVDDRVGLATFLSWGHNVRLTGISSGWFLPLDGISGYPVGTQFDSVSGDEFPPGCPDSWVNNYRTARVFLESAGGNSANVGEGVTTFQMVNISGAGNPPSSVPSPPARTEVLRVRRDYSTWERDQLRLHDVVAPEEYVVTLR